MDLDFTSEQGILRDSAARFLANECPYDRVKQLEETAEGYDPALWQKVAELGWTGLPFPEEYGGYGSTFLDLVIIEEQIGKFVFPSPFFSTVVQCGFAILEGGTEEQKADLLARISEGSLIMALAHYDEDGSFAPELINMTAKPEGEGYALNGTKCIVMDANIAHKLLVAAKAGNAGLSLFIVDTDAPGLTVTKIPTVGKDNTCVVEFKNVKVPKEAILGTPGNGVAVLEKMYAKAAVCRCAEMVGGCKVSIDMTADYAKQREQYGRPIGGYQAIQHYMANMLLAYDTSSNYLYRVACLVDEGQDFALEAAALKAHVNQNFRFITERAVQIHGAIGTTREADIALFYRRVFTYEPSCGDTEYHYEKVAQNLLKGGAQLY
jgi:alkylation response protein AidB-like acyl-CoA dehydrogenase